MMYRINNKRRETTAEERYINFDIEEGIEAARKKLDELLNNQSEKGKSWVCLLYTSPSPRDATLSRMPSSA